MKRKSVSFKLLFAIVACLSWTSVSVCDEPTVKAFTARDLMHGSQGYDVDELQGRLRLLGYYWGKIDGDFGWKTYWAVRTFQYNFGMKVTGYVDMKTKMVLVKATPTWKANMFHSGSQTAGQPKPNTTTRQTPVKSRSSSGSPSSNSNSTPAIAQGTSGLSAHDLNLMAHVVYGEARGEPFQGQVAIAAVILNRMHSAKFPNSIPAIIYSPGAFDAIGNGQANLAPNAEAKRAVLDAVHGMDPSHGALFYFNPAKTSNAFVWSRPEITKIGHHIFTS